MPAAADDERAERIVAAAEACFDRWGVSRTRMEDIAREAGIARPTLYRWFPGKEAVVEAVMVRHIQRRGAQLHAELKLRGRARPLFVRALLAGILSPGDAAAVAVLRPDVVHTTAALVARSPAVGAAMRAYWQPLLDYARARGELRAGVTPEHAVGWLTLVVFSLLTLPELAPDPDRLGEDLGRFVVDAIVR